MVDDPLKRRVVNPGDVASVDADLRDLPLRAEGEGPGPGGPAGFVAEPSAEHERRSTEAIVRVVDSLRPSDRGTPLQVSICHFRWDAMIARNLFGFVVYDFDTDGNWIDPFALDGELRYAIALNQSVELQQEVTLVFLMQTAFRQMRRAQMEKAGSDLTGIDVEMAQEDERAKRAISDRLRYGWEAAAETVSRRIAEAGFRLDVTYSADLFPDREGLVRRMPFLRRLYNDLPDVRLVINKMVSMIGRDDPRVAAVPGGSTEVRDWVQQHHRLWRVRQYMNHALRDAEVLGNGYLAYSVREPFGAFALRPEEVVLDGGGRPMDTQEPPLFDPDAVVHWPGSRQLTSRYGVSVLEPIVPALRTLDVFREARKAAEVILNSQRGDAKAEAWARRTVKLADQTEAAELKKIQQIFWYPLNHLPRPSEALYFEGHERL